METVEELWLQIRYLQKQLKDKPLRFHVIQVDEYIWKLYDHESLKCLPAVFPATDLNGRKALAELEDELNGLDSAETKATRPLFEILEIPDKERDERDNCHFSKLYAVTNSWEMRVAETKAYPTPDDPRLVALCKLFNSVATGNSE